MAARDINNTTLAEAELADRGDAEAAHADMSEVADIGYYMAQLSAGIDASTPVPHVGNEENAYGERTRMRADASQATTAIQLSVSIAGMSYTLDELDQTTDDILDNWQDYKAYLKSQGYSDSQIAQAKEYFNEYQHAMNAGDTERAMDIANKMDEHSAAQDALKRSEVINNRYETEKDNTAEMQEDKPEADAQASQALQGSSTATSFSRKSEAEIQDINASTHSVKPADDQHTDFPHVQRISGHFGEKAHGANTKEERTTAQKDAELKNDSCGGPESKQTGLDANGLMPT